MIWNENNRYTSKLLVFTGLLLILLLLLGKNSITMQHPVNEHRFSKTGESSGRLLLAEDMLIRTVTACDPNSLESERLFLQKLLELQEKMRSFLVYCAQIIVRFFLIYLIWKLYKNLFNSFYHFLLKIVIQYIEDCDGKKKHHLFIL